MLSIILTINRLHYVLIFTCEKIIFTLVYAPKNFYICRVNLKEYIMAVTMTLERNRESLVHKIMSIDSDELIESIAKYVNSLLKKEPLYITAPNGERVQLPSNYTKRDQKIVQGISNAMREAFRDAEKLKKGEPIEGTPAENLLQELMEEDDGR